MEKEIHLPTVIIHGNTGDGKSTILNDIIGSEIFLAGAGSESKTSDYISHIGHISGEAKLNKVKFIDTIGFQDNRNIDSLFLTKTQKYLSSFERGVDLIILAVGIKGSLRDCYLEPLITTLNLLGDNILSKLLIVFTQVNYLSDTLKQQFYKEFSREKILKSLELRGYNIKESQIMVYERNQNDKNFFISKINDIISKNNPLVPETVRLMSENYIDEEENQLGRKDTLIIYIAERFSEGLKDYIKRYFQKNESILKESRLIAKNVLNKLNKDLSEQFLNKEDQIQFSNDWLSESLDFGFETSDDMKKSSRDELINNSIKTGVDVNISQNGNSGICIKFNFNFFFTHSNPPI